MKSIILLSGPVGAGKSTVAPEFIALSPQLVAYIEGDTFWWHLAKSEIGSRHKKFKMIMTAMTTAALTYALYGYEVVLDFSIPPWFLDTARKVVKDRVPIHYVILRPGETTCAIRAAERLEGKIADYSNYHDLYMSFDDAQRYIIPDDNCSPADMAARIREGVDEGFFLV
jgi:adenylate kinase family enzyme